MTASDSNLHINWTDTRHAVRMVRYCPTCKAKRRFGCFAEYWYGLTATCCTCGETWTDGEMHPRPFARGWREESAKRARELWKRGKLLHEASADIIAEQQPLD